MIGMLSFWHHHEMFLDSGKKLQESDYRVCTRIKNSIEIPSGQGSLAASRTWQWIELIMSRTSDIQPVSGLSVHLSYHFEKGHHAPAAMRDWPVGGPQIGRGEDAAGQPHFAWCTKNLFSEVNKSSLANFQFPGFWITVDYYKTVCILYSHLFVCNQPPW